MDPRPAFQPPRRPLVLLVDGHVETLAMYAFALSAMGFNVLPSSDSAEAHLRASRTHPDVIVTEIAWSRLDGWSFVRDLKNDPQTRTIPVVVLTGNAEPLLRRRAQEEGCAALLTKPCLPQQLASGLRDLLGR